MLFRAVTLVVMFGQEVEGMGRVISILRGAWWKEMIDKVVG